MNAVEEDDAWGQELLDALGEEALDDSLLDESERLGSECGALSSGLPLDPQPAEGPHPGAPLPACASVSSWERKIGDSMQPPAAKRRRRLRTHSPPSKQPAPAQAAAAAARAPAEPGGGALGQLAEPLLLRICCFLSPEDLCALARVSRVFHAAAVDGGLWRRNYFARWPKGPKNEEGDEDAEGSAINWKLRYMERDHIELAETLQTAPALLKPLYTQMATAKRSEALCVSATPPQLFRPVKPATPPRRAGGSARGGRGGGAGGGLGGGGGGAACSHQELVLQMSDAIEAFRRQRGLTDPGLHAAHCCGGGECRGFERLGGDAQSDFWICASSGFVHRCGANCTEREVDPASNNLVCPISGRCFDRMMSEDEEEHAAQERGGEEGRGEEEWQADEGISGRLGRAFYAGYNAADERDLLLQYGIRLS